MSDAPFNEKDIVWRWMPKAEMQLRESQANRKQLALTTGEVIEVTMEQAREMLEEE